MKHRKNLSQYTVVWSTWLGGKSSEAKVTQLCPTLCNLWTIQSVEFFRPEYWSGYPFPSPVDLPNPGIEPRSPALKADSLPAEPPGNVMNTGMCSLSLLQVIVPTQELNQRFLHCRQILYQLSYHGSPGGKLSTFINSIRLLTK